MELMEMKDPLAVEPKNPQMHRNITYPQNQTHLLQKYQRQERRKIDTCLQECQNGNVYTLFDKNDEINATYISHIYFPNNLIVK